MSMTDPLSIGAISGGIGTVIGIALTRGIDAIVKYRKQMRDECNADDDRADNSYKFVVAQLTARVEHLEKEVVEVRKAYDSEVRRAEKLQARVEFLERRAGD